MRVISGALKGRQFNLIKMPHTTRPCTDGAKESLFNFLSSQRNFDIKKYEYGCDLFAGTGNIGYEMISRGIQNVIFVDHFKTCVNFIKQQCEEFRIKDNTKVIKSDVFKFIKKYHDDNEGNNKFDIIFAGPPYSMNITQYNDIPKFVFDHQILNKNHGLLILEHDKTMTFQHNINCIMHKSFRSTHFSFFANTNLFEIS